jgi:hypothetical protein
MSIRVHLSYGKSYRVAIFTVNIPYSHIHVQDTSGPTLNINKTIFYFDKAEPPNAYVLPYEREVGVNPSIDQMQELVAQENKRPIIKQEWMQYPVSGLYIIYHSNKRRK